MAKARASFVCQSCGAVYPRWQGKCEACGEWNTIAEEAGAKDSVPAAQRTSRKGRAFKLEPLAGEAEEAPRTPSGIAEFDRVTGGGFVRGSVLLLGGDPGIGKSTLLIEAAATLARTGRRVIYVSGEEAIGQLRMRAARLGLASANVELAAETNVEDILATLKDAAAPALVVIDSIQTLWTELVDAAPHFEGDSGHQFRILRALKNRFGPTDEIGVFEMTGEGLREIENPSALFLSDRDLGSPGTAVFAGIEGTRPLLVEIQALVAPTSLGTPRRAAVGIDPNRLSMILAVLEARCGVRLSGHDVYLNVAGGLRIIEPAADLAVAAALVSSLSGAALPADAVYFGEVSLTGAVRAVPQAAARLKEAGKLGFTRAVLPELGRAEAAEGLKI